MINNRKDILDNLDKIVAEIEEVNQKWHINPDGTRKDRDENFYPRCLLLMGSELSEAFEYLRKGGVGMDDHLPQYLGEYVEMTDLFIRSIDFAVFHPERETILNIIRECYDEFDEATKIESDIELYARIDFSIAKSYSEFVFVAHVVDLVLGYANYKQIPLYEIYKAKTEYNRHRADHKIESRQAEGGKKF